jgi:hypothetical protein
MKHWLALAASASVLTAAEGVCPLYPREERVAHQRRLLDERAAAGFSSAAKKTGRARFAVPASANFIDDYIFGKMSADGVEPAPLADDAEYLRRVMLDLTGQIPTPEQVEQFLADSSSAKRAVLVDSLIASPAFVDYWTLYFGNRFQVTANYYQLIGIPGRNLFHRYIRDMIAEDRPFSDFATELITATGDTHRAAPGNFIMRGIQQGDPVQDTWDTLTNAITTEFLGIQTQCVSCHEGRRHLEEINLYLTNRRREEFMQLSAFMARMQVTEVSVDAFNQQRKGIIADLPTGVYHGIVSQQNPGARPPRVGTYEPVYMFTGERPRSGAWRREFARLLVNDRQFARATVNYLWAHFFRVGIVDPPIGWDLARIDPANPPPAPWTLQPSHPELMEALAEEFIGSGYRLRPIIRLMAQSAAYQLSSRYEGEWKPAYARYFAKHFPRRLTPEEAYDALARATLTETPMYVEGFDEPLLRAIQLPDPSEPRFTGSVSSILTALGRGDWWRLPRSSEGSVVQALYMMNDSNINSRTFGLSRNPSPGFTRVARLTASPVPDEELVRQLFLATLGRRPTEAEMATAIRNRRPSREDWLTDIQWALINKTEFGFNH